MELSTKARETKRAGQRRCVFPVAEFIENSGREKGGMDNLTNQQLSEKRKKGSDSE